MKKSRVPSPHFCNLLGEEGNVRQLWQFAARNGNVSLISHRKLSRDEALPAKVVAKGWSSVVQRKLNIAWLPADRVFLRVVHVPAADADEARSMVELQLEKLSPLPVTQIVWSIELLPKIGEALQPVIVVIAARELVEEFLGLLESSGYLVDRLEIPCLHQLLETRVADDGVWIYPAVQAESNLCLLAWWSQNVLQQVQLLHLPEGEQRTGFVVEQLTKTAWAGEVEGWLTPPVRCHLVADGATASSWEPALRDWAGEEVTVSEPLQTAKLGEVAARRAARGETQINLLPAEHGVRYQQQFVDRLWMGGLGALLAVYIAGVLIYFGALQVLRFQVSRVENQVASISTEYTNAVKLREQIDVLQNQLHLKYAALDCFKAISEKLPADLTLLSLQFQRGQKLVLQGTAPPEQSSQITDYNDDLRKVKIDGQPLFSNVEPPRVVNRSGAGGSQTLNWDFSCDLRRREIQ